MRLLFLVIALTVIARPTWAAQSEDQVRNSIKGRAAILLGHQDFAGLNVLERQYRDSKERTPGGIPKLSLFYAGLEMLPLGENASDEEWEAIFHLADLWVTKYPSPAAFIARARMNVRYAWQQYGADGKPTPEQESAFLRHLQIAHQQLDDSKLIADIDPEWAIAMAEVVNAQNEPKRIKEEDVAGTGSVKLTISRPVTTSADDELNARAEVWIKARVLFEQGKFDELNELAARYRDTGERTPAGVWKLSLIYEGLLQYAGYETPTLGGRPNKHQWVAMFSRAQEWINKKPSPAAYITLAKFRYKYAWQWRGDGAANEVDAAQWKMFFANLKVAQSILSKHKAIAGVDPEWYVVMVDIARCEQWPSSKAAVLDQQAFKEHPYYYGIYYAVADGLQPKWGGSWGSLEEFADFATQTTKDHDGEALYTRVYRTAATCDCGVFDKSMMDWKKMRAGFQDIQKQYPNEWNLNSYAYFACRVNDKATAKVLLTEIASPKIEAWNNRSDVYEQCREWISKN
jgi:hypothetical protein